jgi:hypothetical protein
LARGEVRVSLSAIRGKWNEVRITKLTDDLAKLDSRFGIGTGRGERPTAPLTALIEDPKREHFLGLMEESLADLTG